MFPIAILTGLGFVTARVLYSEPARAVSEASVSVPISTALKEPAEKLLAMASTSSSTEPTTPDATALGDAMTSKPNLVATITKLRKTPVVVGATLLSQDTLADGWASNSWGIDTTFAKKNTALLINFKKPWDALSLYSSGYSLKKANSVEIQLASPATPPATLFVSLFHVKEKIGSVPLAPYQVDNLPKGYFRIPVSDIGFTESVVTDLVIESAVPQKVSISNIRFSRVHASSQLVVTPPALQQVVITPPAVEVQPAPVVVTPLPQPPPPQAPLAAYAVNPIIYRSVFSDGWKTVLRRGAVIDDLADTERSITGAAIKFHFDQQDGSMSFVHPRGIQTREYHTLHMYIYGGVTDHEWQQLIISAYDESGNKLGSVDAMKFSGNGSLRMQTWNKADIPLREINATNAVIKTIDIENVAVTKTIEANDHMWIDDIRLMNDASY